MCKGEVRSRLKAMAVGGGFFTGSTHNLEVDIPTENIAALYEESPDLASKHQRISHHRHHPFQLYHGWNHEFSQGDVFYAIESFQARMFC